MITIQPTSTIYILAPANSKSGGQEALHQLCYYLRKKGFPAKVAYYAFANKTTNPIVAEYTNYNKEFCFLDEIQDETQNLVICPEIQTSLLHRFSKVHKAIWWLSVGFYRSNVRNNSLVRLMGAIAGFKFSRVRRILDERPNLFNFTDNSIFHLTASQYAYDFVKRNSARNVNIHFLIEPLGLDFVNNILKTDRPYLTAPTRKNRILYNPAKKSPILRLFIQKYPQFDYVPLIGMTPTELIAIMKTSKVYVDFGKFPGPERLPKEAAACGCCILTGRQGAAACYEDVRIPDEFKIDRQPKMLEKIKEKLDLLLSDYDNQIIKFAGYRTMIDNLEVNFNDQIDAIFKLCARG